MRRRLLPLLAAQPAPCPAAHCAAPAAGAAGVSVPELLPLLERAISAGDVHRLGRAAHAVLVKTGLTCHTLLSNRLVALYSLLPSPAAAVAAFDDLPHKNAHTYNALLAALTRGARTLPDALQLLDEMPEDLRNVVSYNTVISSLAHHGREKEAISLCARMARDRFLGPGLAVERFTVVNVATACAEIGAARPLRELHGVVVMSGMEVTVIMANAMVNAYSKAGRVEDARRLFDRVSIRDTITWTSMISGYCQAKRLDEANGEEEAALELFERMLGEGVLPTPFSYVSALGACAKLGLATRGKELHCFILRRCIGLEPFNIFIYNALIDMYCKCGNMTAALAVFNRMPERDFVSWNSMVTGFSHNGLGKQSLDIFERMLVHGVRPTHVTFLAVLTACSHSGLVSDGRLILESMQDHGVEPRAEHYAAFIDALGRNHQLEEANEFIKSLSSKIGLGTAGSWGALLGACRVHGNIDLAEEVAEFLFQLEPGNSGRYVMLSNIYSAAGKWDDARRVRGLMKEKGLKKDQAYSWIEVRSAKHVFVADDMSHHETEEIYEMLGKLFDHMRIARDPTEHQLDLC
ncbi:hypothetical protein ACP70R_027228 [Stipagrostis hirtigluma subsp. patula]